MLDQKLPKWSLQSAREILERRSWLFHRRWLAITHIPWNTTDVRSLIYSFVHFSFLLFFFYLCHNFLLRHLKKEKQEKTTTTRKTASEEGKPKQTIHLSDLEEQFYWVTMSSDVNPENPIEARQILADTTSCFSNDSEVLNNRVDYSLVDFLFS